MPEKPDSKRGRVRAHLREHGEASALEFGQSLGIKATRLKRLLKQWGESPTPSRSEPTKVKSTPMKGAAGGSRIYIFGDLARTGTLVKQGPEQSVIRFDNGNERIVSNEWFATLPPEQDRKRRAA